MSYKAFEFSLKTEYVFAENPVEALKEQLLKHQPKKPFVLCLDFMTHIPTEAFEGTNIPYVMRTDVISNPTDVYVNSCAAEATAAGCDFVIGIGGGSVIDSCKTVAMLIANPTEGGIWDYVSFTKQPEKPALPVGLVVTIPSTGSESNPSAVISNDSIQEKLIYTEETMRPRFSITSPSLTYSLPAYPADFDFSLIEKNPVRCPDESVAAEMEALIAQVKAEGDTIGGVITCVIQGCPAGLGEPVFGKLHAELGAAMLSINAAKGFDYGTGFDGVGRRGSQQNDYFVPGKAPSGEANICTATNRSGGIQGGITNGQEIYFRVAFKPVATLLQSQPTVNRDGEAVSVKARGRHDPCVLPRAVPIVEAMAAMVILDNYMLNNTRKC